MKVLDQSGFNEWAKTYNSSVQESNNDNTYPFAGYETMIAYLESEIPEDSSVLDIGIGTGYLAKKLADKNCKITGVDFSEEMLQKAKENVPNIKTIKHDLNNGIPELTDSYDVIMSTYAFHHFDLEHKVALIHELMHTLKRGQRIFIGDISFERRLQFLQARDKFLDRWDNDEKYFVYDEIKDYLQAFQPTYIRVSFCAGVLVLTKPIVNEEDSSDIEISL